MSVIFLLLIIALAVAVGCYVGQKHLLETTQNQPFISRDYFVGLNYLLNEQPDKAVDVFTRLLQVDSETVETHLALGSLFRRRGEIGRAIKIHQNIIARPQISKQHRASALVALGKDYLHAGLIDRAERLFLEITSLGEQPITSLHYLQDIYQQQKNWPAAIKVAQQLRSITSEPLHVQVAHYHCELAQNLLQKQTDTNEAIKELKQALKSDPSCVRANLLLGDIALHSQRYKTAIQAYEQIFEQDKEYFIDALPGLIIAHQAMHQEEKLVEYLEQRLAALSASTPVIIYLTSYKRKIENDVSAIEFLTEYLHRYPSLLGLEYLIQLQLENTELLPTAQNDLLILQGMIKNLVKNRPNYRCVQCGFKSSTLLWHCPGCKSWSLIKPVQRF